MWLHKDVPPPQSSKIFMLPLNLNFLLIKWKSTCYLYGQGWPVIAVIIIKNTSKPLVYNWLLLHPYSSAFLSYDWIMEIRNMHLKIISIDNNTYSFMSLKKNTHFPPRSKHVKNIFSSCLTKSEIMRKKKNCSQVVSLTSVSN